MSKFVCITDVIRFMMDEAEKVMKGSVHEDDLYIVHDDLVLMTAKERINWMKQKGYLHHWLIPLNGLQDGTPYAGRPVGNSPEFMPLDNSLNRDILKSLPKKGSQVLNPINASVLRRFPSVLRN